MTARFHPKKTTVMTVVELSPTFGNKLTAKLYGTMVRKYTKLFNTVLGSGTKIAIINTKTMTIIANARI